MEMTPASVSLSPPARGMARSVGAIRRRTKGAARPDREREAKCSSAWHALLQVWIWFFKIIRLSFDDELSWCSFSLSFFICSRNPEWSFSFVFLIWVSPDRFMHGTFRFPNFQRQLWWCGEASSRFGSCMRELWLCCGHSAHFLLHLVLLGYLM